MLGGFESCEGDVFFVFCEVFVIVCLVLGCLVGFCFGFGCDVLILDVFMFVLGWVFEVQLDILVLVGVSSCRMFLVMQVECLFDLLQGFFEVWLVVVVYEGVELFCGKSFDVWVQGMRGVVYGCLVVVGKNQCCRLIVLVIVKLVCWRSRLWVLVRMEQVIYVVLEIRNEIQFQWENWQLIVSSSVLRSLKVYFVYFIRLFIGLWFLVLLCYGLCWL